MVNFWQTLPKPFIVLAPMEDVTDYVFREIIAEIGKPDVMFTEFTNTDGLFSKGRDKVIRNFDYSEKQRPIVAQIWGNKPETYYKATLLVKELGFEGIDINMGCPVATVMKKCAGAGLIREPNLAKELIDAVKRGAGDMAVSVKTRIGTKKIITEEWTSFLLEQQLDALTIHGRTSDEQSKVPAHWDEIGKVVELRNKIAPETIIIGNGDVMDYNDAMKKHEEYKVDGVMIGRGIFHNPWALSKTESIKIHTQKESLELFLRHVLLYEEKWGRNKNFATMKKFAKTYVTGFEGASELRQQLVESKGADGLKKILIAVLKTLN